MRWKDARRLNLGVGDPVQFVEVAIGMPISARAPDCHRAVIVGA